MPNSVCSLLCGSGDDAAEQKNHLLDGSFFRSLHKALTDNGGLTIFSDNRRYCQGLARTLAGADISCSA
eukprot:SAG31_NODE_3853_length_3816_cov_1.535647_2_plen_69_part_00